MISNILAKEFSLGLDVVKNIIEMIDEGSTIPFIARYRKEKTGGATDEVLRDLFDRLTYLRNLEERKGKILNSIEEQGKLTEELREKITKAKTQAELEDLYRPYKQKKRTRAIIAQERGLVPLAETIMEGNFKGDIKEEAKKYINIDKEDEKLHVKSEDEALLGAMDIIAERVSDNADYRKYIREFVMRNGVLESSGSPCENSNYEMYYHFKEPVNKIQGHRILAINRGEKEKILSAGIVIDEEKIIRYLKDREIKNNKVTDGYISLACEDSFKRLIFPSIEREIRSLLTERAEIGAINIFKSNLKSLLMQPPIKGKIVLGLDPGFTNGCKLCVLDATGKVLDHGIVHITARGEDKIKRETEKLKDMVIRNKVDVISIGNGTASRESEIIVSKVLKEVSEKLGKEVFYVIVNEAGASVYSASKLATKEYPNFDVSIRGAISIARRLQDPMAELVKIDPKSIGIGQYQHDVNQKDLSESLTGTVEDVVNKVGVDINTATPTLLSYVSGITSAIAKNIVDYREEQGIIKSRSELKKVKRLGPKAFEQCAGFLRVIESKESLDNTAVHPESYKSAKELLELLGYSKEAIKGNQVLDIEERIKKRLGVSILGDMEIEKLSKEIGIGALTLKDIIKEIQKPGRDIREDMPKPILKSGVMELSQLTPGMILKGTVRNVADFGAFVDIGVHQDGLVHKSQLADRFVKHPLDIVKVGDIVEVKVLEVEEKKKRISLTMKGV